jgi:hypothetical protein
VRKSPSKRPAVSSFLPRGFLQSQKLKMEIREGRDTLAFFYCGPRLILWVKVPHKRGELKGRLPYYIRQQLRLDEEQFRQLIRCQLRRAEYVRILRTKGLVKEDKVC